MYHPKKPIKKVCIFVRLWSIPFVHRFRQLREQKLCIQLTCLLKIIQKNTNKKSENKKWKRLCLEIIYVIKLIMIELYLRNSHY